MDKIIGKKYMLNNTTGIEVTGEQGQMYEIEIGGAPTLPASIRKVYLTEGLQHGHIVED